MRRLLTPSLIAPARREGVFLAVRHIDRKLTAIVTADAGVRHMSESSAQRAADRALATDLKGRHLWCTRKP